MWRLREHGCGIHAGSRHGRLVVLGQQFCIRNNYWLVAVCDCGTVVALTVDNFLKSNVSCGCFSREIAWSRNFITGLSQHRLHRIWSGMKTRCYWRPSQSFPHYGSRGIKVCEEWRHSFATFAAWALSHGYSDSLTIDRVDSDGDYCPGNCRWITASENSRRARMKAIAKRRQSLATSVICLGVQA